MPFMQNPSLMGVGGSSAESGHLLPVVTFEMLPDRSRKRPKARGDYLKQETKPRDPPKRFL